MVESDPAACRPIDVHFVDPVIRFTFPKELMTRAVWLAEPLAEKIGKGGRHVQCHKYP